MLAHKSFSEAATIVACGLTFIPLALLLGFVLSRMGVHARDSRGVLRKGACAGIATCYGLLVVAHTLVLCSLDLYHPAVNGIYLSAGVIMTLAARAKPAATSAPSRK